MEPRVDRLGHRLPGRKTELINITPVRGLGRNLGLLVGTFFVSLAGFIVCLPLFVVGVSLFWIVVGLFVLVACLVTAGGFASVHRSLLHFVGRDLPRPFPPKSRPGLRGRLRRLRDGQSWRHLLHVPVTFVLSVATFSVGVTLAVRWAGRSHVRAVEPVLARGQPRPRVSARVSRLGLRRHRQHRPRPGLPAHTARGAAGTGPAARRHRPGVAGRRERRTAPSAQ